MNAMERMLEEWWRDVYLPTLTPEEREAEIASRGWLWRAIKPSFVEAVRRRENAEVLRGVSDTATKDKT